MKKNAKKLAVLCFAAIFSVCGAFCVSAKEYVEQVVSEDFASSAECSFLAPGDMNANGKVDADDLVSLRQLLLSNPEDNSYTAVYEEKGEEAIYSDINGDESVDIKDLVRQKKNSAENFVFVSDGAMSLNGNSAFNGDFISVLGSGAEYEISYTYKSNSAVTVKINGLGDEIVYTDEASSEAKTVSYTIETPLTIDSSDGIELQIIGVGTVESFSVTRINMDNELVENW